MLTVSSAHRAPVPQPGCRVVLCPLFLRGASSEHPAVFAAPSVTGSGLRAARGGTRHRGGACARPRPPPARPRPPTAWREVPAGGGAGPRGAGPVRGSCEQSPCPGIELTAGFLCPGCCEHTSARRTRCEGTELKQADL